MHTFGNFLSELFIRTANLYHFLRSKHLVATQCNSIFQADQKMGKKNFNWCGEVKVRTNTDCSLSWVRH